MKGYEEFMPKKTKVMVGEELLEVREYVAAKRDAVISVLLADLDIVQLLEPFKEAVREVATELKNAKDADAQKDEGNIQNLGVLAEKIKGLVQKVFSRDFTRIMCITLDTAANRKALGIDNALQEDGDFGYEYSPQMFKWVAGNLTISQEPKVLEAMLEVNDFIGLVKNYKALITAAISGVMGGAKKEEKPAKAS